MSEKVGREGATKRSSASRKAPSETALPAEYLEQLEQKRKQLDESIHKYIASKDREYKQFEKDLKHRHRASQGQEAANGVPKQLVTSDVSRGDRNSPLLEPQRALHADVSPKTGTSRTSDITSTEANDELHGAQDRSAIAGLKDRRASVDRDKEFAGLFTPPYLSALDATDAAAVELSSSAPQAARRTEGGANPVHFERANSDSVVRADLKRPPHLALAHRNSSSGSSFDGKLPSAMKSPTQPGKRKRVSLAVGDSIVAPSDSVPVALSHYSSSSHSRIRSKLPERAQPVSVKRITPSDEEQRSNIENSVKEAEVIALANAESDHYEAVHLLPPAAIESSADSSRAKPRTKSQKIDPDGDLFDLVDEDSDSPAAQGGSDDDSENALESEDEIAGRVDQDKKPQSPPDPSKARYDSTAGIVPEPGNEDEDSAVPYLAFGPGTSVGPREPGFRRPSVVHDPVYQGKNYDAAEKDAVENEVYGSSFNRPSSKGSFTAGSLGESYMAQHAEEMMRVRSSQQQAKVKS